MNIIVDTNIIFSALLNANGLIGELLLNSQDEFRFFSPELMKEEINRYSDKLVKASKLTGNQFTESSYQILTAIKLISEAIISPNSWTKALNLTANVDENDTPFVALAIEMNGLLWTGDKKLITGLREKGFNLIISTQDLLQIRREL